MRFDRGTGLIKFSNTCSYVVVCDSNDPNSAGFLRSTSFGQPVTTAGGCSVPADRERFSSLPA